MRSVFNIALLVLAGLAGAANGQEIAITVQPEKVLHRVSPYLAGACLEDVNHEVYGGIDSQMIFGESFAEPAPQPPLQDFTVFGGRWTLSSDGGIKVVGSDGAKIVWAGPELTEGEASVDVWLTESAGGNGGLILKVSDAGKGADAFKGYEVALERPGILVLGRHRHNWEPIRRVPCDVPVNQWITLTARMTATTLEVLVNGKSVAKYEDTEHPLQTGKVGLRSWQHDVRFRNFSVTTAAGRREIIFALAEPAGAADAVSGMWRPVRRGTATGAFTLEQASPFSGRQSQRVTFVAGAGEVGIENQSLNRWGMNFVHSKAYEGYLYARSTKSTELFVALESRAGKEVYAEKRLKVAGNDWQRLDFTLKPSATDSAGRFVIKLKEPGDVALGYAFLQPGSWGRFKGLPVRKDVAQGLIEQGIRVLRYGGCMANAGEYRWKKMIGPRAQRPPYEGWWYPQSSNGWGIFDFLNFCEAAGFLAIPDMNMGESPQDMADFMEYVNGPSFSEWGRKRAADGHPKPYHLKYLQLGNEEQVNEDYWRKFQPLAEAIWAKDSEIILVVGDFAYHRQIQDPFSFSGADGRITTLAAQQKILQLAKRHDREVWFDVHVGTDGPRPDNSLAGALSYVDAIDRIADGAKHRVVVFELNAGNPTQRRAIANALAINALQRDGRLPIVTSANCLQPDGQNDNDWNQGLLFLNPTQVWLQPPGYLTRMIAQSYQPLQVQCEVSGGGDRLDAVATRSDDGKNLVLRVVNVSDRPITSALNLSGFAPRKKTAEVQTLAAPLAAHNTATQPNAVQPQQTVWRHGLNGGRASFEFPAHSVTVIRL